MKNKFIIFTYIALLTIVFGLFMTSCDDEEKAPILAPSITLNRVITASSNDLVVTFVPSETSVRFVYAIGNESDLEAFTAGTMSNIKEVEGNAEQTITFPGLDESTVYSIFARAYSAEGNTGPVATIRTKTRTPINNFSVTQQYLTDNSVAYTILATNEYYKFDYALGKSSDKAIFESGVIDGFETREEISKYTANYFLLEPDTKYTFFVRGYDRQSGQVSETREYEFTTAAKGSVPSVDFKIDYMNIYSGDYTYTPNQHCGKFATFIAMKDEYKTVIEDEINWRGDMWLMMETWTNALKPLTTVGKDGPLKTSHITAPFISGEIADPFGYPMETYILLYDKDDKIFGIQKHEFQASSYNENAGKPKVGLKVSNITTTGALYEFIPNEQTLGIFFQTFEADWYENFMKTDEYYEGYVQNYLYYYGYWSYTHNVTTTTFPERTAAAGKRYYVFYLPMGYNGPNGGWGDLGQFMYTTAEK